MILTRNEVLIRLGMILDRLNFIEGTKKIDEQVGLLGHGIGLDSIEILSVVAAIEDEFSLTLEDEELQVEYFRTLGSLVTFIQGKLA
jgi:acyl carrier protein